LSALVNSHSLCGPLKNSPPPSQVPRLPGLSPSPMKIFPLPPIGALAGTALSSVAVSRDPLFIFVRSLDLLRFFLVLPPFRASWPTLFSDTGLCPTLEPFPPISEQLKKAFLMSFLRDPLLEDFFVCSPKSPHSQDFGGPFPLFVFPLYQLPPRAVFFPEGGDAFCFSQSSFQKAFPQKSLFFQGFPLRVSWLPDDGEKGSSGFSSCSRRWSLLLQVFQFPSPKSPLGAQ